MVKTGVVGSGRIGALSIGVAFVVLASSDPAAAQSALGGAGLTRAPTLPTLGRSITGQLIFSATYDNNIAHAGGFVAAAKDLRPDDILYQPSADLDFVLPVGPAAVFLNGTAGYDFYQYNKVLQRERIDLVGGLSGHLGPCTGGLTGGYAAHQSDQADLPIGTTKNTQTTTSYGAQVSCHEGRALGENLSVQIADSTNDAPRGVVDSKVSAVNGGISYTNKTVGSLSLTGGVSKVEYKSPDTLIPPPPGFNSYDLGVSLSRPIGSRLDGMASIYYSKIHSDAGSVSDYSTWAGQGSLTYRVNPRLQATLSYDRSAVPSLQQGFGYSILQSYQLNGRYLLTQRLSASLGARWYDQAYHANSTAFPGQITEDKRRDVYGGAKMTITKTISLAIELRHTERNTNLTIYDYKDNRFELTATKTF